MKFNNDQIKRLKLISCRHRRVIVKLIVRADNLFCAGGIENEWESMSLYNQADRLFKHEVLFRAFRG